MRTRTAASAVIASGILLCCGATERPVEDHDGGGRGSGPTAAAGTTGEGSRSPCDAPNAFPIWVKTYDAERDCIDTEAEVPDVACTLQPTSDDPDRYYSDGFSCLRRLADGEVVWTFAFYRLGFDPTIWERCPNAPVLAPKGCYAAGCTEAPRSSCALSLTKQHFNCSATGEFDENCCGRTFCDTDADCPANEQCAVVQSIGQIWCWDYPGKSGTECDCGGPYGGPVKRLCMAP